MMCDICKFLTYVLLCTSVIQGIWIKGRKVFLGNRRSALVRELCINHVENIFQSVENNVGNV
jgi:hypothetical protein